MSTDDRPSAPTPALRRYRWWILLLGLVILGGGALWWSRRLTPEERFLVGHWKVAARLPDGSQELHDWEFFGNRRICSKGTWFNWTANGSRITIQQYTPTHMALWVWVKTGFKSQLFMPPIEAKLEIIDNGKASIEFLNVVNDNQKGTCIDLHRIPND